MHDGSLQTLWDVMDHYNKGGEANPYLDGGIEPLALTEAEIDQLVAFMFTLTDERFRVINEKERGRQARAGQDAAAVPQRRDCAAQGVGLRAARRRRPPGRCQVTRKKMPGFKVPPLAAETPNGRNARPAQCGQQYVPPQARAADHAHELILDRL